jgi:molybdate transport system substrate-binding protein
LVAAACGDGAGGVTADDTGAGGAADPEGSITVFAAASLTDAFGELADRFEDEYPGVSVELSFAGSSSLREQILAGAPADVFASANVANMTQVVDALTPDAEPATFARNRLEIAVPAGNPAGVSGLSDFGDDDLLVGLCAEGVPCGDFGREALANAGVASPAVDTNEADVRSLLTKVASGDLDAGIVYRTDVLAAGDEVDGITIPAEDNVAADYPIVALADDGDAGAADAFVAFVLSDTGQEILASHGFDP